MGGETDQRAVRVVVADTHEVVREGIRTLMSRGCVVVDGDASTAAVALDACLGQEPNVLITDLQLGDSSGIELVRELRRRGVRTRCVVFASRASVEDYYQAVLAGIDGFVLKDQPLTDLVDAVLLVAAGGQALGQEMLDRLHGDGEHAARPEILAQLSQRERSVLELLAQGLTNREIAEHLFVAEKTVRNNVSGVLAKLGMRNRTQVAAYIAGLALASATWASPGVHGTNDVDRPRRLGAASSTRTASDSRVA